MDREKLRETETSRFQEEGIVEKLNRELKDQKSIEYTKGQAMVMFLIFITANPDITRDELIDKLQISRDQYYRYLKELNRIIPIAYSDTKPHYTFPYSKPNLKLLGDPEMFKFFLVLLNSLTVRYKITEKVTVDRIHRLLGIEQDIHSIVEAVIEKEHDDDDAVKKWSLPLIEAINRKKTVRLTYRQEESKKFPLEVEPLKLIHDGQWWYLLALYNSRHNGSKEMRYYKLQRIEEVEILDRTFTAPENPEIVPLSVPWDFGSGDAQEVVIRFSGDPRRYIREKKYHPTSKVRDLPNGDVEMIVEVREPEKMIPWILSFGTDAEVLEPAALREALAKKVRALIQRYP